MSAEGDPELIKAGDKSLNAYVTAVVGAGGKTGFIRRRAEKLASEGLRVAILTTTHILEEPSSEHIV